jgi:disulfide oxidoreductase YuzD
MTKRKEVEVFILKYIDKILPGGENKQIYLDMFKDMSNKEFESMMERFKNKEQFLSVVVPNSNKVSMDIARNYKIADELGYSSFQHLTMGNSIDDTLIKTNNKYLVLNLPFKRASQSLIKKISIPEDNNSIDLMSGQVTNKSKGAKLTMPEIQILVGSGLKASIKELLKYRGGDIDGQRAMETLLDRYGSASQDILEQYAGGVISKHTLKSFLLAMHLKSTL